MRACNTVGVVAEALFAELKCGAWSRSTKRLRRVEFIWSYCGHTSLLYRIAQLQNGQFELGTRAGFSILSTLVRAVMQIRAEMA